MERSKQTFHQRCTVQLANKYMKRCLTSLVTRRMWIKTTMKRHYTSIRISQIKINWPYQMLVRMWSNWNSHTPLVRLQNGTTTLESHLAVFYEVKHTFNHTPSNPTPRYLPKWFKTYVHTKTWTQTFITKNTGNNPNIHLCNNADKSQIIIELKKKV